MIATMELDILSTDIVRPSSATPNDKKIYSLSFFDRIPPRTYVPLVFFYSQEACHSLSDFTSRSVVLKKTLSAALSRYYPLAGRIRDNATIDCNDEGVVFWEARIKCQLAEILKYPRDETIKLLFPDGLPHKDSTLSSPLVVQITFFDRGGIALAICMSHQILDMASMCYFINNWAAIACNLDEEINPEFNIGSLYPPIELPLWMPDQPKEVKCVTRRLVFSSSKIAKLKSLVANKVQNPTRVEVVAALIYKCAISAAKASSGSLKPTILHQAANLRNRVSPPMSETAMGNLSGTFSVSTTEESEMKLICLVLKIRQEKNQFFHACMEETSAKELCSFIWETSKGTRELSHGKTQNVYICTSWCGFPYYEANFGWGKPVWVTSTFCELKNVTILMDTREGDGIEAFVTLEEQEMALFESHEELLAYASINPTALDGCI